MNPALPEAAAHRETIYHNFSERFYSCACGREVNMESTQLSASLPINKAIPAHLEIVPQAPGHQSDVLRLPMPRVEVAHVFTVQFILLTGAGGSLASV